MPLEILRAAWKKVVQKRHDPTAGPHSHQPELAAPDHDGSEIPAADGARHNAANRPGDYRSDPVPCWLAGEKLARLQNFTVCERHCSHVRRVDLLGLLGNSAEFQIHRYASVLHDHGAVAMVGCGAR